jgi:putative membrane protein
MRSSFLIIGVTFVILGGIFHIYVFVLESISWLEPKTRKIFGLPSLEVAQLIKPMAFNQGFYNLFLALGTLVGGLVAISNETVGFTLMLFASASMVGAGLVLFFSIKRSRRAAYLQALPPLIGIALTTIGLAIK